MVPLDGDYAMNRSFIQSRLVVLGAILLTVSLLPVRGFADEYARILSCDEEIVLRTNGSAAVTVLINVAEGVTGIASFPSMFGEVDSIHATPPSVTVERVLLDEEEGRWALNIHPNGATSVQLTYDVANAIVWEDAGPSEFSSYTWGYRFQNWSGSIIESYSLGIALPQGWNYHRVLSSTPKMEDEDTFPPYVFNKDQDGNGHVTIRSKMLRLGDDCGIEFIFKPKLAASPMIAVGILAGMLYLFFFRSLLTKANDLTREENMKKKETIR